MPTAGFLAGAALSLAAALIGWRQQEDRRIVLLAALIASVLIAVAAYSAYFGRTEGAAVGRGAADSADFDENGIPDVVLYDAARRTSAVWLLARGAPVSISSKHLLQPTQARWHAVAAASAVGSEGKPGIVLQHEETRAISLWSLGGVRGTDFIRSTELTVYPLDDWRIIASADFDHNSRSDLLLWSEHTRQISIWFLGGDEKRTVVQSSPVVGSAADGWHPVSACDFDRNGRADILLQNRNTREISLWLMGGASGMETIGTPVIQASQEGWAATGCTDFDGNGTPDIVLESRTTGGFSIWLMAGDKGTKVLSMTATLPLDAGWRLLPIGD